MDLLSSSHSQEPFRPVAQFMIWRHFTRFLAACTASPMIIWVHSVMSALHLRLGRPCVLDPSITPSMQTFMNLLSSISYGFINSILLQVTLFIQILIRNCTSKIIFTYHALVYTMRPLRGLQNCVHRARYMCENTIIYLQVLRSKQKPIVLQIPCNCKRSYRLVTKIRKTLN